MQYYVALIHKESRSDFGVIFPDLPGCVSAGATYEEAIAGGTEALNAHIATLNELGDKVPAARSVEQIRKAKLDWVDFDGAMVTMLPILPVEGKSKPFNVSMDSTLMEAVDAYAKSRDLTRSGVLAAGARLLLASDPVSIAKRKPFRLEVKPGIGAQFVHTDDRAPVFPKKKQS